MRWRRRTDAAPVLPGYADLVLVDAGPVTATWTAHELSSGRTVTVLRLASGAPAPWDVEAFRRQVRALTAVGDHPNVVTLHRVLRDAADHPVLVLEHATGTLADRLAAEGVRPAQEVLDLGARLAAALEALHRYGFAHRDVRPGTVLVSAFGEPLLAGFGATASLGDEQAPGLVDVTGEHVAPELLEGRRAVPATDVYGLASTLYTLLAGDAPLRGRPGDSDAETVLRILRDPVPPVVRPGVPAALSDVLLAALAKDPDDRPATAAELAELLAAVPVGDDAGSPAQLPVPLQPTAPTRPTPPRSTSAATPPAPPVPGAPVPLEPPDGED